jgi:L-gulonate 5-dehydrogenase
VGDQDPAVAALIEPVSIAIRAVVRGRVSEGEKVVVFGAGPIGQALSAAALDRGASVLLIDPIPSRLGHGAAGGAEILAAGDPDETDAAARDWAGADGPEVVFEATGDSDVARRAVALVAQAGRVVVVGLSRNHAPLRAGDLAFKEIDMLGVSCCNPDEFADAVDLVGRRRDTMAGLVTHQFPLDEAPDAIVYAMRNPAEVMKAVIRLG